MTKKIKCVSDETRLEDTVYRTSKRLDSSENKYHLFKPLSAMTQSIWWDSPEQQSLGDDGGRCCQCSTFASQRFLLLYRLITTRYSKQQQVLYMIRDCEVCVCVCDTGDISKKIND